MALDGVHATSGVETSFEYPTLSYKYAIETSLDGRSWSMLTDKSAAFTLAASPHRDPGTARAVFVRITLFGCERSENGAGIYSFKVFGQ